MKINIVLAISYSSQNYFQGKITRKWLKIVESCYFLYDRNLLKLREERRRGGYKNQPYGT